MIIDCACCPYRPNAQTASSAHNETRNRRLRPLLFTFCSAKVRSCRRRFDGRREDLISRFNLNEATRDTRVNRCSASSVRVCLCITQRINVACVGILCLSLRRYYTWSFLRRQCRPTRHFRRAQKTQGCMECV